MSMRVRTMKRKKLMIRVVTWVAFLTLLVVPSAWSRVIVVDRGGGGDATTIQAGIEMAVDGDTVRVMPGYYEEGLWWTSWARRWCGSLWGGRR
jgi:pectin methylesterase-like acyl-CoA thioesterase